MKGTFGFLMRHLSPLERSAEILCGLIMALGFSAAVRLGIDGATGRQLFFAILGCNVAWGIVDGVLFVLLALFQRNLRRRILRDVAAASSEEGAVALVAAQLDDQLEALAPAEDRQRFYRAVATTARRGSWPWKGVTREDVLGGAAAGVVVVLATLPVVVPFLLVPSTAIGLRLSNLVALVLLFVTGIVWARRTGARALRFGAGLVGVGIVLVVITVLLGG